MSDRIRRDNYLPSVPFPRAETMKISDMAISLPLEQWQVIVQALLVAPYARAKEPLESIKRQAEILDAQREQADQDARAHAVNLENTVQGLRNALASREAEVARMRNTVTRQEIQEAALVRQVERLRKKQQRADGPAGNGAEQPRKRRQRKPAPAPVPDEAEA